MGQLSFNHRPLGASSASTELWDLGTLVLEYFVENDTIVPSEDAIMMRIMHKLHKQHKKKD